MGESTIDAIARGAADALSRRSTLRALGAATMAAGFAGPVGVEAKKNAAKRASKRLQQRCDRARDGCRTIMLGLPNPDEISQIVFNCCDNCLVGDFWDCINAALSA